MGKLTNWRRPRTSDPEPAATEAEVILATNIRGLQASVACMLRQSTILAIATAERLGVQPSERFTQDEARVVNDRVLELTAAVEALCQDRLGSLTLRVAPEPPVTASAHPH